MAYFAFRRQPLQTFYYLYVAFSLLLVRVPYWTIRYALPSTRPVPWSLGRMVLVKCYRVLITTIFRTTVTTMCFDPTAVEKSGKGDQLGLVWTEPAPDLIVLDEIKEAARVNNIKPERTAGYWLGKRGPDGKVGQQAGPDEKVIYGFHGGGFVMGSAHPDFATGYIYRKMFDYVPKGYERIFQCEYRLSWSDPLPAQGAFPAALFDALAGYQYLVRDLGFKPSNILIMGESAGANLALQLTRYLAQNALPSLGAGPEPGAASPRGQLLLSPASDWGHTQEGPESSFARNWDNDMVHDFFEGFPTQALIGHLPPAAAWENSWISPGSTRIPNPDGLFRDLPPTCIIIGGGEMMLDPVRTLRDRLVADIGVRAVTYVEIPHAAHVPMTHAWHEPENTQGYEASKQWLESLE
ncbi:alpha/beta-hydrolase [Trametes versicolor FP-101664 SS1]|uniref:alpha/beta-hydrolase n=1 Tax=Trametes versicolor (strain FP-101664) TaxID=717944 RepID=UPI0004622692|nr:alpha/beta-hydrolase [Trametes versicolor FP-101664 SS1]EIW58776.1 alpha/beta-hydrolase [Trametes versicolor FP-101664 SS1]